MNKVFFFTGSRAEFGMVLPVLYFAAREMSLSPSVVVSGSHLAGHLAESIVEISEETNVRLITLEYFQRGDSVSDVADATANFLGTALAFLEKEKPRLVVVYADRSETFAMALAAFMLGIPIAHIEGGDLTAGGTLDDQFRHAITKFASLHFVSNASSRSVVLQLGEDPGRVMQVGSTNIDRYEFEPKPSARELATVLGISMEMPTALATFHPYPGLTSAKVKEVFLGLEYLLEAGIQVVLTYPNTDSGYEEILGNIELLRKKDFANLHIQPSLGSKLYMAMMSHFSVFGEQVGCVIGNSSSVIKDSAHFTCPAVAVGSRQRGRTSAGNVLWADEKADEMVLAVDTALFDSGHRDRLKTVTNPYRGVSASRKIVAEIAKFLKEAPRGPKEFFRLGTTHPYPDQGNEDHGRPNR